VQRPRIKYEHRPRRFGEDRVRIGGRVYGLAAEMADPHGWLWAMLDSLDGTRTVGQVATALAHRFPELTEQDVRDAVQQVIDLGYVEDAAEPGPPELSDRDAERHSRGRAFYQWVDLTPRQSTWHAQLRLRRSKAIVIGLGGTGGAAALALAMSGVGHVHCVEPDLVELSNLNRQILYTEKDVGQPKVDAAVERLRSSNTDIVVTGDPVEVDGPDTIENLVRGYDVLVLGADRPAEIRSWANRACRRTGTPWVHAGYHGPQVTAGVYRPGTGPCFDCARQAETERRSAWPPLTEWAPAAGHTRVHAANVVTAGMSGNLAAHLALSLLTGAPKLPVNCLYGMNLVALDHSFRLGPDEARPDCPTCEGKP
jgi:molybdopterin-synthase adenylyltransferase